MTSEEINKLPEKVRNYIHALETDCDPAGTIRENVLIKEENESLRRVLHNEKVEWREKVYCAALTGLLCRIKENSLDDVTLGNAMESARYCANYSSPFK